MHKRARSNYIEVGTGRENANPKTRTKVKRSNVGLKMKSSHVGLKVKNSHAGLSSLASHGLGHDFMPASNSLLTRLSKKDEHMFNVWPFSQRTCRHECLSAGLYVPGVEPQARTRTQLQRRSYSVVRLTGPVRSVVGEWSGVWH